MPNLGLGQNVAWPRKASVAAFLLGMADRRLSTLKYATQRASILYQQP